MKMEMGAGGGLRVGMEMEVRGRARDGVDEGLSR